MINLFFGYDKHNPELGGEKVQHTDHRCGQSASWNCLCPGLGQLFLKSALVLDAQHLRKLELKISYRLPEQIALKIPATHLGKWMLMVLLYLECNLCIFLYIYQGNTKDPKDGQEPHMLLYRH